MDGHSDDPSINEDENALFGVLGDLNVAWKNGPEEEINDNHKISDELDQTFADNNPYLDIIKSLTSETLSLNVEQYDCIQLHNSHRTLTNLRRWHAISRSQQVCNLAHRASSTSTQDRVNFDTDSSPIIVDSGASAAFSHCLQDFTEFKPITSYVRGLGTLTIKGIGTVQYNVIDDKGIHTTILIRNA